jgi:hypothetical protein
MTTTHLVSKTLYVIFSQTEAEGFMVLNFPSRNSMKAFESLAGST